MDSMLYDTIVIGAGIAGLYTACHLTKQGRRTLVIEQYELPHKRGSSHGLTRATQRAHPQDFYVRMMQESHNAWLELESESGTKLFQKTGLIAVGKQGGEFLESLAVCLTRLGERYESLSADQLKERYPMLRCPDGCAALFDGMAGVLWAETAMVVLQKTVVQNGGEIRTCEKMTKLFPGEIITVTTTKGSYKTRSLVICAGPWAGNILKPLGLHLPLECQSLTVCYYGRKGGEYRSQIELPCVLDSQGVGGIPVYCTPTPGHHMKVCLPRGPPVEPGVLDDVDDSSFFNLSSQFVREHLPGMSHIPTVKETCIFTRSPDENFILDTHPEWKNIVVGAGFSGKGFMFAPVVGKVLAELSMGKASSYDLTPFRIQRFS